MRALRNLKRLTVLAAVAFVVAVLVAPGAVASQNYENVFCVSTIDPRCAGANLPILIEAGIVSGGGTTATTAAAGGTATAALPVIGGGLLLSAGTVAAGIAGPAVLSKTGLSGLTVYTDPTWSAPGEAVCSNGPTGFGIGYEAMLDTPSLCIDAPVPTGPGGTVVQDVQFTYDLAPASGGTPATLTWGLLGWEPLTPEHGAGLVLWCEDSVGDVTEHDSVNFYVNGYTVTPDVVGDLTCFSPADEIVMLSYVHWATVGFTLERGVLYDATGTIGEPTGGSTSLEGTFTGDLICKGPLSGIYSVAIDLFATLSAGSNFTVPTVSCDDGDLAVGTTGVTFEPTTGGDPQPLVPETEALPQVEELVDDYPDCFGPGVAPCHLELWKIGLGGQLESCGSIGQLCIGWALLPDPSLSYKCFYGPYEISINACSAYRDPTVGILPNVGEDGEWLPPNAPIPGTLPNDTGTGTSPGADPGATPDGSSACWPSGWGVLNPVSWVYMPMKCALEWAFVPRPQVVQTVGLRVTTAWDETLPAQAPAIIEGWESSLPYSLGGCQGPPVDFGPVLEPFGIEGAGTYYPLSVCEEPFATIALTANWVISGSVAIAAALAIVRYLASVIGFVGFGKNQGEAS